MYKNICTFNFFLIKLVLVILEGDESMPNMKNAVKKVKQIKKTTELNRHYTSTVKNAIKNMTLDLRVSSLPVIDGEKIVIRILDYSMSLNGLENLIN